VDNKKKYFKRRVGAMLFLFFWVVLRECWWESTGRQGRGRSEAGERQRNRRIRHCNKIKLDAGLNDSTHHFSQCILKDDIEEKLAQATGEEEASD